MSLKQFNLFLFYFNQFILFLFCFLALINCSSAAPKAAKTINSEDPRILHKRERVDPAPLGPWVFNRTRREGFGPWEAQETWDEKGKSTIVSPNVSAIIAEVIKEELNVIKNATMDFVQKVEEPFVRISHSYLFRTTLAIIAILLLCKILQICYPIFLMIFRLLSLLFTPILWLLRFLADTFAKTTCYVSLATMWPIYKIRLWIYNYRLSNRIVVTHRDEYEMAPLISSSEIYTDTLGPYLKGPGNCKIYFQNSPMSTHDFLNLSSIPSAPTRIGGATKETVLANSKFRSIDSLPPFQGQFMVDGVVIGHFSRINYKGKDCIITAHHVLSYNQGSHIQLVNKNNSIDLCDIPCNLVAFSRDTHFDWVVYELPSAIFSRLGLKVGKIAKTLKRGAAIQIHQIFEGEFVYSMGIPFKHETLPWHMKYRASTIQGSSGAPILNVRQEIVGIHLEGSDTINTGVVPAVFRDSRKESIGNDDLFAGDSDYDKYSSEATTALIHAMGYHAARLERQANYDVFSTRNWAKVMDDFDDNEDYEQRYIDIGYAATHGQKESPWTCSSCNLLHLEKRLDCSSCGAPLKNLKKQLRAKLDSFNETSMGSQLPSIVLDQVTLRVKELMERLELTERLVEKHLTGELGTQAQRNAFVRTRPGFTNELAEALSWQFPQSQDKTETQTLGYVYDDNWNKSMELAVCTPNGCETLVKLPHQNVSEKADIKETSSINATPTEENATPVAKKKNKRKKKTKGEQTPVDSSVSVKETVFREDPQVPATSGGTGSAGAQQNKSSPNLVLKLEKALALSEQENQRYKTQLGVTQSLLSQISNRMTGQTALPKQSVPVSSFSVTNSSKATSPPMPSALRQ